MKPIWTICLLVMSNVFMTLAWYGHLRFKDFEWSKGLGLFAIVLISWGIAFFEYMIQVPANRLGHQVMTVGQLKVLQEVVTLSVFVPFSVLYMKEKLSLDYLWAGLCLLGAVFFLFRTKLFGS